MRSYQSVQQQCVCVCVCADTSMIMVAICPQSALCSFDCDMEETAKNELIIFRNEFLDTSATAMGCFVHLTMDCWVACL